MTKPKPKPKTDYGRAIRILRAARNLTQEEVARKLNCGPSMVSLMEAGKRMPSVETLQALEKAFKCQAYVIPALADDDAARDCAAGIINALIQP